MHLSVAGENDSEEIKRFFESFQISGMLDYKLRRPVDFFSPYRTQSDQFSTYLLRDEVNKNIEAIASFVIREGLHEGEVVPVAYATDLRVSNNRRAILEWVQHFLPVLQEVYQKYGVKAIFSNINQTDITAMNTFVRPRPLRRPLPRYFLYRKYYLNTLHGRFPWAPPPLPTLRIRPANEKTQEALIQYLIRRSQYRPFSSVWSHQSFQAKMQRLKGLKLDDFILAFDANDNVIGCAAPWSPAGVQDYLPISYSLRAHNFRQFLKFGRLLGMSRSMTKPKMSTGLELPLKFRFLTHVHADNEDVFESLLWNAFDSIPKDEFLVYPNCEEDYRLNPPQSWIAAQIPYALYAVVPPDRDKPSFLDPSSSLNPEIESCWL